MLIQRIGTCVCHKSTESALPSPHIALYLCFVKPTMAIFILIKSYPLFAVDGFSLGRHISAHEGDADAVRALSSRR